MILLARLAAMATMMEPHPLSSHKRQLHEKNGIKTALDPTVTTLQASL